MTTLSSICVYCGSRMGTDDAYARAARELGELMAARNITLVYGGGRIGLMGVIADTILAAGGHVIGIIPHSISRSEISHQSVSELYVVDSMHERKQMMFDKSDAFIALPGGLGTLDESFEMLTWRQLHFHDKPILLLNTNGYWQPLLGLIDHIVDHGFAGANSRDLFLTAEAPGDALALLSDRKGVGKTG